jgi:hypothetical protein
VLARHRGVRNVRALPPLTEEVILLWANEHRQRTGKWPNGNSGEIPEAPGEVWRNIDMALREGNRGFPGGSTLAKLLASRLGVRTKSSIPRLGLVRILEWADEHYQRTGKWPNHDSGPIIGAQGETWLAVESALSNGVRGLDGGSSLYRLLKKHRNIPGRRPGLRKKRKARIPRQ